MSTWLFEPTHRAPRVHHAATTLRLVNAQTSQDIDHVLEHSLKKSDNDHAIIQKLTFDSLDLWDCVQNGKIIGCEAFFGKIVSGAFIRGSLALEASASDNSGVACEYAAMLQFVKDDKGWISRLEIGDFEVVRWTCTWGHLL